VAVKAADRGAELIEAVLARVRERIQEDRVEACEAFVRQYYRWVPEADLSDREPLDLYGAAIAHWNLAQQRPGEGASTWGAVGLGLAALAVTLIVAVAVVLVLGLINMMRGGSPNRSQKLMRLRVLLQFVAIIVIMATIWAMGR